MDFVNTVKTIFKRLFRIYAHIYHSHLDKFQLLGAEAHLNTCFKHFIYFTHAFQLVDRKELAPLQVRTRSRAAHSPLAPLSALWPRVCSGRRVADDSEPSLLDPPHRTLSTLSSPDDL